MIDFTKKNPVSGSLVIPCFENQPYVLPEELKEIALKWVNQKEWKAKNGCKLNFTQNLLSVTLLGLGKKEEFEIAKFRSVFAEYSRNVKKLTLFPGVLELDDTLVRNITEAFILAQYKFDNYKKSEDEKKEETPVLNILAENKFQEAVTEGKSLASATKIARDLVNEPANVIYPETLASEAVRIGEEKGYETLILEEEKIAELGMEAFLAVARAAEKRPRLIIMRYFGDTENKDNILGLVGKGLTYDTGGLCLKPAAGMVSMKSDMGGSAAVIGAMSAIAEMKLKKNVIAVIAACENSIGGNAYRPGDIIGSMAGKTIEVGNTDAEGRLTLIDAVHYAIENEKVTKVVDIATLTGACLVALGKERAGVVSNNDDFYKKLETASELSSEKIWRMPHDSEYLEALKSPVADLNNSGGRLAGTVTAGLFIGEFVQSKPWLHIDIAGVSGIDKPKGDSIKGATGSGSRLLYFLAKEF